MREWQLIQLFGSRHTELGALQTLMGGVTMTHLRAVRPTKKVFEALIEGLRDPNPRVRWWCVQILDHSPDPQAIAAIAPMLDDPVPRVRQNAAHALGCLTCKPALSRELPTSSLHKLKRVAIEDPHAKVRRQASWALGCLEQSAIANNR
jgi:HEAT repeat protein